MERTTIEQAINIMGTNFIGPNELNALSERMGILTTDEIADTIPEIKHSPSLLTKLSKNYILILGIPYSKDKMPLTLNRMREFFGIDPDINEPCFYNQDWYIKESFANNKTLDFKWYLIRKIILEDSRAVAPENYISKFNSNQKLPSAILTAFTFFVWYLQTGGEILWKHDFLWCSDIDHNGDRIYTGKYIDVNKINKNGFSIHRHLAIRSFYGITDEYV
ncbi:MAG: hypothetical protein Q8880_08605 [Bacteroidota bacterium]|nr:hypothetical protein [Bacteroidota bacterium]